MLTMDLNVKHGKQNIACFSRMQVLPCPNLNLAPVQIVRGIAVIERFPVGGIFEAKWRTVLDWASSSTIGSRGTIEDPIPTHPEQDPARQRA